MKKFLSCIMAMMMLGSFVACGGGNNGNNTDSGNGGGTDTEVTPMYDTMDKDYVYMWNHDGLINDERRMCFQTEDYSLVVDARSGKLIGAAAEDGAGEFVEMDVNALPSVDMGFYLKIDGTYEKTQDLPTTMRIIESGRYVNRLDNISLRYPKQGTDKYGRIEYVATNTHVALNYELYSVTAGTFDIAFDLTIEGASITELENGMGVKALDDSGNGFAFLKQSVEDDVLFNVEGSKITFVKEGLAVGKKKFSGFGVMMVPVYGGSTKMVDAFLSLADFSVSAVTPTGTALPVRYECTDGIWMVDVSTLSVGTQDTSSGRNGMERANITIENRANAAVSPTVAFVKENASFSVTGMSPMLRSVDTLEPTGEQVQISKNWHQFSTDNPSSKDYAPIGDVKRIYNGLWYHGYTAIEVGGATTEEREYTCVYGNWGGVYAASHAQLCLIGWGGNQLWDQSALGSWGESVTYDPDIGLNRSMIDDVRPFLVKSPTGNNKEFDWSGNVGGGDFLNYIEDGEQRVINQKITYRQQAPNMTDVIYSGVTSNGKIATEVKINLGRTDDIVRNYYTIKYEFLADVTYGRLSLFKIAADGYADNSFTKYAYGTDAGATVFDKNAFSAVAGYENGATQDAKGKEFWYTLYSSTNSDEGGDVGFVVRSFDANINGKHYDKPGFNLFGTNNKTNQMSCEITVPTAVGKTIKKGSVIEMVIEYDVIPNNMDTYYGESDYLLLSQSVMGTSDGMYQQVVGGNIKANASVGSVLSTYPVAIKATSGETAAQFTLTGGLGYVPVSFTGLQSFSGYKLQQKVNGSWVDVDQAVKGNDYWQAYKAPDGTYTLTYNVKNTDKLNFNSTNEYRLIYA